MFVLLFIGLVKRCRKRVVEGSSVSDIFLEVLYFVMIEWGELLLYVSFVEVIEMLVF